MLELSDYIDVYPPSLKAFYVFTFFLAVLGRRKKKDEKLVRNIGKRCNFLIVTFQAAQCLIFSETF